MALVQYIQFSHERSNIILVFNLWTADDELQTKSKSMDFVDFPILANKFEKKINFRKYRYKYRLAKTFCKRLNFWKYVCRTWVVDLGDLLELYSCKLHFSKLYVLKTLLKWLTCHTVATIFSRGVYLKHICRIWLGWLAISRKNIQKELIFKMYVSSSNVDLVHLLNLAN